MLEFTDVDAGYGQLDVLFSVSLPVPAGKITAVLGPNGAGKTTALKTAAGLITPRRGSIRLRGDDITGLPPRVIARQGLCLIPEGRGIFPSLTVRENLVLQAELSKLALKSGSGSGSGVEDVAYAQFPVLGRRRKQLAGTLSGGEQHMLALSRALTTDPQIILIDEISMGLAPNLIENLFDVVVGLARAGRTVVLVEQLAEFVLEIADFVTVLAKGVVAAIGEPRDVRQRLQEIYLGAHPAPVRDKEAL